MNKIKLFALIFAVAFGTVMFSACSSDEEITQEPPAQESVNKAREFLTGDIVLSTKAKMGSEDKTHLANGCPTIFNFTWNEDGTMTILLDNFHVGAMPFNITFKCRTKSMKLNTWEKDEYAGSGWIAFKGKDGSVSTTSDIPDQQKGSGASVDCFYNVDTHQIQLIVNYNMMNVRSDAFLQTIDKERINNWQAEFDKYQEDLEQWKKDHGQG